MRCKKHFTDLSSSAGVCASCLRERLFALIAAQVKATQAQSQSQAQAQAQAHHHHLHHGQVQSIDDHHHYHHRKSEANNPAPPLVFPRSVSPYISRRKSDNSVAWPANSHHLHHQHNPSLSDQRFYSTPQIGPSGAYVAADHGSYKKKHYRFSLITNIFRSRSNKRDSDSNSNTDSRFSVTKEPATSATSSSSWFSGILHGRRRKQSRLFSLDEPTTISTANSGVLRIHPGYRDRGMSPARFSDDGDEDECCESGYSSESSQWKQTPVRGTKPGRRPNHARNVSGLAFCLSPLVRASPNRHWNQKGIPPEAAFSGEIRVSVKPNIPNAAAFCKNRSRKLADFGRSNPNH